MGCFKEEIIEIENIISNGGSLNDTIESRETINRIFSNLPDITKKDIPGGRQMSSFIAFEIDEGFVHGQVLSVSWNKNKKMFYFNSEFKSVKANSYKF